MKWFAKLEQIVSKLSCRRTLAVLTVGTLALVLRAAVLPIEPIPEPIVHDEFGYLLAADTFAHGRLTNPTPAPWMHFETFHVMFHPSYASIYPPAQGFVLAAGRLLAGNPFWGVWLSVGAMCATITWMLQGWMPAQWALLGGVLAVLRYGVFTYWADSYWGGAVAAIGGALVLGALPRIKSALAVRHALVLGSGFAILANSRPYEGFVLSVPVVLILLAWMLGRDRPPYRMLLKRFVLPLALVVSLSAVATGFYFWRITGNPFLMPYQVERRTYAIAPYMIWQPVRPEPSYHHAVMKKMFVDEEMLGRKDSGALAGVMLRIYLVWSFYLGPALVLPLLMLIFDLPKRTSLHSIDGSIYTLLFLAITSAIGSLLVNFYSPHYSAPTTGLVLLLVLLSMRQLYAWGKSGLFLARTIPIICVISFAVRAAASPLHVPLREFYEFAWYQKGPPSFGKVAVTRELENMPGRHLVIVHYAPDHRPFDEWVYNDADLYKAKVVWARDMGRELNEQLLASFVDRSVWLLNADERPPRLEPYPASFRMSESK